MTKITRQRCKIELLTETVLSDDALNPTGKPKEQCVTESQKQNKRYRIVYCFEKLIMERMHGSL